eukprot:UN10305
MSFAAAAEKAKTLPATTTNEEKLKLYGLYKQATVGDINIDQPWAVQVEARAKWDAWAANKGMSKEEAEQKYIAVVDELVAKYGA